MDKNILAQLEKITGKDGVLSTPEDLAVYSYDGTFAEHRPDAVVLPRTGLDVQVVHPIALLDRAYRQESEVSRLRRNQEISHSTAKRKNDG